MGGAVVACESLSLHIFSISSIKSTSVDMKLKGTAVVTYGSGRKGNQRTLNSKNDLEGHKGM